MSSNIIDFFWATSLVYITITFTKDYIIIEISTFLE